MPTNIKLPYSQTNIDLIQRLIEKGNSEGQIRWYSVLIDDIPVTSKTNNLDSFLDFEEYLQPSTKQVVFRLFFGNGKSNNNDTYILERKTEANKPASGLGNLDENGVGAIIDQKVQEKWVIKERELELKTLQESYENLKKSNARLKKQVETLEEEKAELQNTGSKFATLGRGAAILADNFILGSKLLPNTGLGSILNGLVGFTENIPLQEVKDTAAFGATFTPVSDEATSGIENEKMAFVNWLIANFTEPEYTQIMQILQNFAGTKANIKPVLELINGTK